MMMMQKQPSRAVLKKRCSENMQQTYRITPMQKCDFNKSVKRLHWNHTSVFVFPCKFAAYFQNTFLYEHLWMAPSDDLTFYVLASRSKIWHYGTNGTNMALTHFLLSQRLPCESKIIAKYPRSVKQNFLVYKLSSSFKTKSLHMLRGNNFLLLEVVWK